MRRFVVVIEPYASRASWVKSDREGKRAPIRGGNRSRLTPKPGACLGIANNSDQRVLTALDLRFEREGEGPLIEMGRRFQGLNNVSPRIRPLELDFPAAGCVGACYVDCPIGHTVVALARVPISLTLSVETDIASAAHVSGRN
jgi:hypothetical protein